MSVKTVRRLAAKILRVGESRVWIKPGEDKRVGEALTADDVRGLIREHVIAAGVEKGVPRFGARQRHAQQKKGRRGGSGSRRGSKYSRVPKKTQWAAKTRLQRSTLHALAKRGALVKGVYRSAYRMIKGNAWRSKAAMLAHFKDAKWLAASEKKA